MQEKLFVRKVLQSKSQKCFVDYMIENEEDGEEDDDEDGELRRLFMDLDDVLDISSSSTSRRPNLEDLPSDDEVDTNDLENPIEITIFESKEESESIKPRRSLLERKRRKRRRRMKRRRMRRRIRKRTMKEFVSNLQHLRLLWEKISSPRPLNQSGKIAY